MESRKCGSAEVAINNIDREVSAQSLVGFCLRSDVTLSEVLSLVTECGSRVLLGVKSRVTVLIAMFRTLDDRKQARSITLFEVAV